jgi:hypothetical protein
MNVIWNEIKEEVLANIKLVGISDKGFTKTVLTVYRRAETCKNMLWNGASMQAIYNTTTHLQGYDAMQELNGSYNPLDSKYGKLWVKYCEVANLYNRADFNDFYC